MESNIIQIIVQAGSVGVALVALYIIYKLQTAYMEAHNKIADAHRVSLDRNTESWLKNTEALTKLNEKIK